jgi:octaprenyl-diphosphate synthase
MDRVGALTVDSFVLPSLFSPGFEKIKERIYTRIRPDMERIEAEIDRQLNTSVPLISVVGRYIMGSGGKRLRPLLMILSARLCGYKGNHDVPLSVVFEFIHAASLLHDDVVDHAEVRRNKPAANTIWGNPAVVLVGDFLYSKSFLMTVGYDSVPILQVISETTTKMAEGEVLQLIHADDLEITQAEYLEVITRKTAVLISAACQIGAIFGGGGSAEENALRSYGHNLGIAFQLIDDTLDYTGDVQELGKPVGNDIQEGKATLPLISALKNGLPADKERLREIFSAEEIRPEDFAEVKELVIRSGGIEYTRHLAIQHVQNAKDALSIFPEHSTKEVLTDIADYVICRRM